MKTAIYPGSFDPPTVGHLDIIARAADIFDELIVACLINPRKQSLFTPEQRVRMLNEITCGMPNVRVDSSDTLLAEYAGLQGASVIIKGLRAMSDFEMEFQMALVNRKLNPALDTMFLTAGASFQYLSSSMIKEIGAFGGDISDFIPKEILSEVECVLRPK